MGSKKVFLVELWRGKEQDDFYSEVVAVCDHYATAVAWAAVQHDGLTATQRPNRFSIAGDPHTWITIDECEIATMEDVINGNA